MKQNCLLSKNCTAELGVRSRIHYAGEQQRHRHELSPNKLIIQLQKPTRVLVSRRLLSLCRRAALFEPKLICVSLNPSLSLSLRVRLCFSSQEVIQFTKDPYLEDVGPRKMWWALYLCTCMIVLITKRNLFMVSGIFKQFA